MNTPHLSSNCLPDTELVAQIVDKSEWALEELYRRYNSMLRAVIRRAAVEELDGDAIARSAERFSATRFRREMQEAAAACAEAA